MAATVTSHMRLSVEVSVHAEIDRPPAGRRCRTDNPVERDVNSGVYLAILAPPPPPDSAWGPGPDAGPPFPGKKLSAAWL